MGKMDGLGVTKESDIGKESGDMSAAIRCQVMRNLKLETLESNCLKISCNCMQVVEGNLHFVPCVDGTMYTEGDDHIRGFHLGEACIYMCRQ